MTEEAAPVVAAPAPDPLAPIAVRSAATSRRDPLQLGPLEKVYMLWLAGASCEGCTVAVTGGTRPRLEQVLAGAIPGVPRVDIVHTTLSVESGAEYVANLVMAERGELDAPYIITCEGSVLDEGRAGDGFFMGLGELPGTGRQMTSREWLSRLAPGAAAVIALGSCATWGGIPAAKGSPTGACGVTDYLGTGFRSSAGLPVINIPGCAPAGDNYLEVATALLLFLNGLGPAPELDGLSRPAWLFADTVHHQCKKVDFYEQGVFADDTGGAGCLVELGCRGPVVECNMAERGAIDGHGGCLSMGGICIGCTMPGFPDRFSPMHEPMSLVTGTGTAVVRGGFLRRLGGFGSRRAHGAGDGAGGHPHLARRRPGRFYRTV